MNYPGNLFAQNVDDEIFADIYRSKIDGQEIGKPLALAMLKNALANCGETDKISEKLRRFVLVADAADLAELHEKVLPGELGANEELKIWENHFWRLKINQNYVVVLAQPNIFQVTRDACLNARDGCTNEELYEILVSFGHYLFASRERQGHIALIYRNLHFQKSVELLKEAAIRNDEDVKFPLLLETSDWEYKKLNYKAFEHPAVDFNLHEEWEIRRNSPKIYESVEEKQVFDRITDSGVINMIVREYDRFPQGFLTDEFASIILDWVLGQFFQAFPDHPLRDTLENVRMDPMDERWIISLAEWYLSRITHSSMPDLTKKEDLHSAVERLVMNGMGNEWDG